MFCTVCGAQNSDDNFFCTRCGSKLMRVAATRPQQWAASGSRSRTAAPVAAPQPTPAVPGSTVPFPASAVPASKHSIPAAAASPAPAPTAPSASVRPPVWQNPASKTGAPAPVRQAITQPTPSPVAAAPAYPAKPVTQRGLVLKRKDGTAYALDTFPITVGKGTAADVRIDGNSAISRVHARIGLQGAGFVLEDCGSTNGTLVNGSPVPRGGRAALAPGDRLTLGNEDFSVMRAEARTI